MGFAGVGVRVEGWFCPQPRAAPMQDETGKPVVTSESRNPSRTRRRDYHRTSNQHRFILGLGVYLVD